MTKYHVLGGALFGIGWMLFIDGLVWDKKHLLNRYVFRNWLPVILATVSTVLLNMVKPSDLRSTDNYFSTDEVKKAKGIFFIASIVAMASFAVAVWLMIQDFQTPSGTVLWPGVSMLLSCIVIVGGAAALFFARSKNTEDSLLY